MSGKRKQLVLIFSALLVVLVADQITKEMIMADIPEGSVAYFDKANTFFWISHERNPGLVGGAFRNTPTLALGLSLVATCVLIYLYRHLYTRSVLQALAYGMVAGGAAGNMIDRIRLGTVTDFLQFHFYFIPFDFPWKLFPAFNIADSAICTGVFLLVVTWHHFEKKLKEADAAHPV